MAKGPKFLQFYIPILEVLRQIGGSGQPSEVTDAVIEQLKIPEDEQQITLKNGQSSVRNKVAWARFYLMKNGYLDSSIKGLWKLTEKGKTTALDKINILDEFKTAHSEYSRIKKDEEQETTNEDTSSPDNFSDHRDELLSIMKSLPPSGFEHLCQRLLRESGFEQVVVTGKSNDGGIDGHGILDKSFSKFQSSISVQEIRQKRFISANT